MLFQVRHVTTYHYTRPVSLGPHWIRLRPRDDGGTKLLSHELDIQPTPERLSDILDMEGNLATCAWFTRETDQLSISSRFEARTLRTDPYDYLPEPMEWNALYPLRQRQQLAPWIEQAAVAPSVLELARTLRDASRDGFEFVHRLNDDLYRRINHEIRDTGHAHAPEETLRHGRGACRDVAVLFAAICHSQGLATRFVSGYQKGRGDTDTRYMHAWAEVYLPGGGWRGFDPTHGLAVSDQHIAVAAAADAAGATPIDGSFLGDARSTMHAEVHIHAVE